MNVHDPRDPELRVVIARSLMAQEKAAKAGMLAIWTVYDRPRDHPSGHIARLYVVGRSDPAATDETIVGDLDTIRAILAEAGLTPIARSEGDEPQIVESWL